MGAFLVSDKDQNTTENEGFRRLLTTSEAAKYLGIHPETLTKLALEGHIKYRLLPSGRRRYRAKDLEAVEAKWVRP